MGPEGLAFRARSGSSQGNGLQKKEEEHPILQRTLVPKSNSSNPDLGLPSSFRLLCCSPSVAMMRDDPKAHSGTATHHGLAVSVKAPPVRRDNNALTPAESCGSSQGRRGSCAIRLLGGSGGLRVQLLRSKRVFFVRSCYGTSYKTCKTKCRTKCRIFMEPTKKSVLGPIKYSLLLWGIVSCFLGLLGFLGRVSLQFCGFGGAPTMQR